MKILLLHDNLGAGATVDEADIFAQIDAVRTALEELGHEPRTLACTLDLDALASAIRREAPDLVFNLVESINGQGRLIHVVPALLDALGIRFTGCPTDAIYATSNKLLGKRLLQGASISTPPWHTLADLRSHAPVVPGRYIVKSVWEHASRGLDEDSVIEADSTSTLLSALESRLAALGGEGFVEAYIDGREFNLSILAGEVLPPAEIDFRDYAPDKPRVVGYRAKWDESSFEYHHTPRRFDFPPGDRPLLQELRRIALECWRRFGLRGYARVDFRVDGAGRPSVLEINTNPCLSPDAGFAAAVRQAGLSFTDAIARILRDAMEPETRPPLSPAQSQRPRPAGAGLGVSFRTDPRPSDSAAVRDIVASTGFFHDFEVDVAVELIDERLERGLASEYYFVFADDAAGNPVGYACFGPIACTVGSFDLYWIAVRRDDQGRGLGLALMAEAERRMAAGLPGPDGRPLAPARCIYIETSSKPEYEPTRAFYRRCGYIEEARFRNFYAPGDDKIVYVKSLD